MDKELIERARQGDRGAFVWIYHQYRDDMLTIAMCLVGHSGLAEDVVQDVFVSFIDSLESFELTGSLKAYFAVCVANKARDILRKNKVRQSETLEAAETMAGTSQGPLTLVIHDEQTRLVRQGLDTLPYEQREVIILRTHSQMSLKEIAVALDVPLTTVSSRWQYGLDKLRTFMKEVNNA